MGQLIGTTRPVSQDMMAQALKSLVWSMEIEKKWYEVEFTGLLDENDRLIVNIKKPTKAPVGKRG